jgi:hypothetical protein
MNMTAYNSVRMRVKPGNEDKFLEMNRNMDKALVDRMKANGLRRAALIKTGDRTYCFIGEWESMDSIAKSRPDMIKDLDTMRDLLEDLGGGLGVTDPVSGPAVHEM